MRGRQKERKRKERKEGRRGDEIKSSQNEIKEIERKGGEEVETELTAGDFQCDRNKERRTYAYIHTYVRTYVCTYAYLYFSSSFSLFLLLNSPSSSFRI